MSAHQDSRDFWPITLGAAIGAAICTVLWWLL